MKNVFSKAIMYSATALLFISPVSINAQKGEVGAMFMPTFSSLSLHSSSGGSVTGDLTVGYGGGVKLGYYFTEQIGIQGEIIYNSLSQDYKEQDIKRNINLKYINIPLLLSLNTGKLKPINVNVVVGPQIGISVGSSVSTTSGNIINVPNAKVSVKRGDIGFAYGAGVDFGVNSAKTLRVGVGFRGVYGLVDISGDNNNSITSSYQVLDRTHIVTYSGYVGVSYLF
jgi:hypothetical protein